MSEAWSSPLDQFIAKIGLCTQAWINWAGLPIYADTFLLQFLLLFLLLFSILIYIRIKSQILKSHLFLINISKKFFTFFIYMIKSEIETITLTPLILFLVTIIFTSNFIGMVPYSMTLTSQILMTLSLAIAMFVTINIFYFVQQKIQSLGLFLPSGTPLFIVPFLIQIEIISYISRVISLSVRLFANMTSGHALLKILSGFSSGLISAGGIGTIIAIFPTIIVFIVTGLELLIAGLQTYVFIILTLIYLHELEVGGH